MSLPLLIGSGGVAPPLTYVDDVFSAYTYTGNNTARTITNGIDLAGKGGLVWTKPRDATGNQVHILSDSAVGLTKQRQTSSTAADTTSSAHITAFNANGFSLGTSTEVNNNNTTFVSWTFRKAPKFFDVVTYTGNATNRTIAHSLGQEVGLIFIKRTDTTGDWQVYHRSLANTEYLVLNTTAAKTTGATRWNSTTPTTSVFSLGTDATVNASGGTYVAYLFAHDTSADGIIQCGSFTTDGSGNATVNLGWEPQYIIKKPISTTGNWYVLDTARGLNASLGDQYLWPNSSGAEANSGEFKINATGFSIQTGASTTHVYLAIRRPNKPPTTGTQVYNAIARTGTGAAATVTGVGFAPDLHHCRARINGYESNWSDKLRGPTKNLWSDVTGAETTATDAVMSFEMDGVVLGVDSTYGYVNESTSSRPYINHFFKRAPGVFDQVCYTGTGVAKTEAHGLGVAPELMIVKGRDYVSNWICYHSGIGASARITLSGSGTPSADTDVWQNTIPTASIFSIGVANGGTIINNSGSKYVAYLFATKAGISKVGSYTGNGSTQTINCGFTTGARFILIKRTDSSGDWYVWDTVRGIISANDPHLSLNTTSAEVTTDDSIDPDSSGFIVNQLSATNINVSSATYIFLSIA
jgi:hypothetical protein